MKISVENNLGEIKKKLVEEGYKVYDFSDNEISDIYIYSEDSTGLLNLNRNINGNVNGSLIINAYEKSINEIMYSVKKRLYSPLF